MITVEQLSELRTFISESKTIQISENDPARVVITHQPEFAQALGSLHPGVFLFTDSVDLGKAKEQHENFCNEIRKLSDARVLTVRQILLMGNDDMRCRLELEDYALSCFNYKCVAPLTNVDLTEEEQKLLTDDYKAKSLRKMTTLQLVDIIMCRPTILIKKENGHIISNSVEMSPLTNLTFTRDQQITTAKGVVMGNMTFPQRKIEKDLMQFIFKKLGIEIIGSIPPEDSKRMEGGDFIPYSNKLCFIGVGLRTNMEGVKYMLDNDLFGTEKVAVVVDEKDRNINRLHLDTVFCVLGEYVAALANDIVEEESKKRYVIEYTLDSCSSSKEKLNYTKTVERMEFSEYLVKNRFELIFIPSKLQMRSGCNMLNLGKGKVISTNEEVARVILRSQAFKGVLKVVPFSQIISMNGAAHCASFVIRGNRN